MRVTIFHAEDDREIKIILPTDLIMNPLTAAVAAKIANKKSGGKSANRVKEAAGKLAETAQSGNDEEISEAAKDVVVESLSETAAALNIDSGMIAEAFRTLKKFKKKHPELPLVDVYSADGDRVLIML